MFCQRLCTRFLLAVPVFVLLLFLGGCAQKTPVKTTPPASRAGDGFSESANEMAKDGQYKTSIFFYKKAIDNYQKAELWDKAISCYIKVGDNYQKLDDTETALGNLNQALKLTRSHLGYQPMELAKGYQKLAFKYMQKKNFDKALELYQRVLAIQLDVLGKDHPETAKTYNSISLIYWNLKKPLDAHTNYTRSYLIKLRQKGDIPKNMDKQYHSISMGKKKYRKKDLENARNRFSRSLEEYRKRFGQNKPLFAALYEQIGILYAFEGDYGSALDYLRKSFDIRLELYGHLSPEVGTGYLNIGICLRLKNDNIEALKFLNFALTNKSEALGPYHPETADIYYQIGKVHYQKGEWEKSLDFFQKALVAQVPGFDNMNIDANPNWDSILPSDKLLEILRAKANSLRVKYIYNPEHLQDLRNAFSTYSLLARLVETMRQGYRSESYKLFFGEKVHTLYQQAIETTLLLYQMTDDLQYKEHAFVLSEKSKAGVLAEALLEAEAKQFAGIPPQLLLKEKELKEKLTYYDTYLQKELRLMKNPVKIANLENRYHSLVLEYRKLIKTFETAYPDYYELKYKPLVVDIQAIRQRLEPGSALLEYFIGENVLNIFVLTRDGLEVRSIPLTEDLSQLVSSYKRSISKIEEGPFMLMSWKLYRILLKPVRHLLKDKVKLVVIPDGLLHTIPFEALTANTTGSSDLSQLDYMIKEFAFSYHYSANLWLSSASRNTNGSEKSFIGFAPVFGENAAEGYVLEHKIGGNLRSDALDPGHIVTNLPASEDEVQAIIRLFHSQQKKAAGYFHSKASEANFKQINARNYNLIHIATHSLDEDNPGQLPGLVFSPPPIEENMFDKEDGILYSGEIYNLSMDAQLIVLSSCESGVGKLVKGEGMMALNRGFFYSGIRNIVFSLWKVEDRSTSRLMIAFYRNILDGHPFCRALREAKLEMIKDPFSAFPKYWSGFILVGR